MGRVTVHITERQIEEISLLYREQDLDAVKDHIGVRRFQVLEAAIAAVEAPRFNSGKPMHLRGRLAESPFTLPLEAREV